MLPAAGSFLVADGTTMPPLLTTPRAALSGGTRQNSAVITPASAPRGDDSASRRSSGDDSHVDGPLRKTPRACKLTGVLYLPRVLLPGTELAEKMLDWLPEPRRGQLQQQLRDAKEKEGSVCSRALFFSLFARLQRQGVALTQFN